jgi:taurine transport system ATP-binding protein
MPDRRGLCATPCRDPKVPSTRQAASALDNVACGLKLQGIGRRARREQARELLRLVGLENFANAAPWQLSGGMRQRVGLARALATNPKMLLMDEPLGALDSLTRETMQELILRLWSRTRKRVLFITHSIEEALFMSTSLVVFSPRPGRIIARFQPDHVHHFLQGEPVASVKSRPTFVAMREEIRALIHGNEGYA